MNYENRILKKMEKEIIIFKIMFFSTTFFIFMLLLFIAREVLLK